MTEPLPNAYDEVSYPGFAFPQTHPDRLATIATLFGMNPAPVEHSRVLELGCGDGGNLIPLAFGLPGSKFLGIDQAARPIAQGRAIADALGLKNLSLNQGDIMEVSMELGRYDYIIAHGVYSWVPPTVQDKLLEVCSNNLAPNGVAYVSYNTFPGWHLRNMVREMMQFHTRQFSEPAQRIDHGLALIKFLAASKSEPDLYHAILKQEFERLTQRSEASIYHDELAEKNYPLYFFQFIEHAAKHDLQFLSEANFFEAQKGIFSESVRTELGKLGDDVIAQEQYLDFLKCRKFRQTLLCHQKIAVDRSAKSEHVGVLYVAAPLCPTRTSDINSVAAEEFRTPKGASITVGQPIIKAALLHLGEIWPRFAHFADLLRASLLRLDKDRPQENEAVVILGRVLWQAYAAGVIELHRHLPQWTPDVSEKPVASPLARLQLKSQVTVTNLRHASVQVEGALERQLLLLLDGTRNRTALLADLKEFLESSLRAAEPNSEVFNATQQAMNNLTVDLEPNLQKLARLALLIE